MSSSPSVRIGDLCELVNGRAFKPTDWTDKGLPIVRIQNLNDPARPFNHFDGTVAPKIIIDDGDVLLSWSGTPGTSFGCFVWTRGRAILNQHIFKVRLDRTRVDHEYFVHVVNSKLEEMISLAHGGVGLRHITKQRLEGITLPLPPLAEQRRIVARINDCAERIQEIRQLRVSAAAEAKSLESAMFRDFVMEGVGREHWPTVTLGDITESSKYGTSAKARSGAPGIPVLRMGNIVDGYLDCSDLKYLDLPTKELAKYRLQRGDILINRTNSLELVGKAAAFDRDDDDWVYASYLVRIRIDRSRARPEYVTAVINSWIGRDYVLRTARRAIGMVNINAKEMAKFPIPLPPLQKQEAFIDRLSEIRIAAQEIRAGITHQGVEQLHAAVLRRAFAQV